MEILDFTVTVGTGLTAVTAVSLGVDLIQPVATVLERTAVATTAFSATVQV